MSHILMVGAGAHGHVNPHLPVIAELVRRGHHVQFAIPAAFADTVARTGAEPLVLSSVLPDEDAGERWPDDPVEGMTVFLDEARHVLPQLDAALGHDRPDLLLSDIGGYAARVLGPRWGVPTIELSPAMVAWEGFGQDTGMDAVLASPGGQGFRRAMTEWLAAEGSPLTADTFLGHPERSIVLIPRVLQPHADRVDPAVHTFVGPDLAARDHQDDWPAPDRPLVLVSLGSAYTDEPAFFRACAEAFGGRGWQVVLAVGRFVDPADLGPLPDGVEVHAWVPQLAVLRHASLFVTHAGMGGCSEGLACGVPMIAVPRAVDQFSNAAMLVEAGVGTVLAMDEADAAALRAAGDALLGSPEVAARCRAAAAELAAAGGAARTADIVEEALTARDHRPGGGRP